MDRGVSISLNCVRCSALVAAKGLVYTCPACGGNLLVRYDLDAIRPLFNREILRANPERSIWRYLPLLPVCRPLEGPPVGWTPLVEAPKLAQQVGVARLRIKDEGKNPSASFKDRASAVAIEHARELGHHLLTGASTGNAASATAVLSASVGMKARIFVPAQAPQAKIAQLLVFGAEVFAVDGTYDDAFDLCLATSRKWGWYNRNTGYNPYTREGKKTAAFEIAEQCDWNIPDAVVISVGDGNILSGVYKGFEELAALNLIDRVPRMIAVQAEGSDAIVRALESDHVIRPVSGKTVADSISVAFPRDGDAAVQAILASHGLGIRVLDDAILDAIGTIARNSGVFCEPAGAAPLAGLLEAIRLGHLDEKSDVVLLNTGNGLKDIQSATKRTPHPHHIPADIAALESFF